MSKKGQGREQDITDCSESWSSEITFPTLPMPEVKQEKGHTVGSAGDRGMLRASGLCIIQSFWGERLCLGLCQLFEPRVCIPRLSAL